MRWIPLTLALFVPLMLLGDDEFIPGKNRYLKWEKDAGKAVEKARKKYKPILLYFYHEDSGEFCREAEEEYFKKPDVKSVASKFVCIKLESAGEETEDLRKELKVDEGEALVMLLDCRFREMERIDETDELEELKETMKDVLKRHKEFTKKLKTVDRYFEYAETALRRKRMRDYVRTLEEVVKLRDKLSIDDPRISEASKRLSDMEKAGDQLLNEAERLTSEAERWFRSRGTSGFRQDLVNQAQQKLAEASSRYPLSSLAKRAAEISMRLNQLVSEYQRLKQEEQQQKKNNP